MLVKKWSDLQKDRWYMITALAEDDSYHSKNNHPETPKIIHHRHKYLGDGYFMDVDAKKRLLKVGLQCNLALVPQDAKKL